MTCRLGDWVTWEYWPVRETPARHCIGVPETTSPSKNTASSTLPIRHIRIVKMVRIAL